MSKLPLILISASLIFNVVTIDVCGQDSTIKDNNAWIIYQKSNSAITDNNALKIILDKEDNKWIATEKGGLVKLKGADWTIFQTNNSLIPHNSIYAIAIDENDVKWVGTYGNGLSRLDDKKEAEDTWFTNFNTTNSLLPHVPTHLILSESTVTV